MEQVRLELCLEQEEEANRQREIVSNSNATTVATLATPAEGRSHLTPSSNRKPWRRRSDRG